MDNDMKDLLKKKVSLHTQKEKKISYQTEKKSQSLKRTA